MAVKDPVQELEETEIWKFLNLIDKEYARRCLIFVKSLTPILKSISNIFPFYTRHDAHHSYRVLKRMEQILDRRCLIQGNSLSINNIEAFLLICSAYAHDLGMAIFPGEKDELLSSLGVSSTSKWEENKELHNYLRNNHSERGGKFIDDNFEVLEFPKNLTNPLHLLMKAHNMSINQLDFELSKRIAGGEKD